MREERLNLIEYGVHSFPGSRRFAAVFSSMRRFIFHAGPDRLIALTGQKTNDIFN